MTSPEMLESSRAEPDFEAMDEVSEFAVEHAAELAQLDRRPSDKAPAPASLATLPLLPRGRG